MADAKGRDVNEALIYVTGYAGIAPVEQTNVITEAQLSSPTMTVPTAYKYLGLRTSDGGPEQSREAGEALEFLEDGFVINTDGSITVAMTLAQYNAVTRELSLGSAPDANGVIKVKDTTPSNQHILLLESTYKSGAIKREHGVARISEITNGKDERGTVNGIAATFTWVRSELFDNSYYWEAYIEDTAEAPETP